MKNRLNVESYRELARTHPFPKRHPLIDRMSAAIFELATEVERLQADADSAASPERIDIIHRIMHEFTGKQCRDDGGWCDARDHAEAIVTALQSAPSSPQEEH